MLLANQRILLGPGPRLMSPRVMEALGRRTPCALGPVSERPRGVRHGAGSPQSRAVARAGRAAVEAERGRSTGRRGRWAVRSYLLQNFTIEIGAGLGPLAGKVFRVGLMGTSSSQELVDLLCGALEQALKQTAVRKA